MRLYLFLRFLRKKDTSYVIIISPIQSLVSTPGVWFHVLCDALRTRNTFRAEDILPSCRDNQYYYVDRAWWLKYWSASGFGNSIIILLICPLVVNLWFGKIYMLGSRMLNAILKQFCWSILPRTIGLIFRNGEIVHGMRIT